MTKFIAKPHTLFQEGAEINLITYLTIDNEGNKYGLFEGKSRKGGYTREVCPYDEFDIITEKKTK